MQEVILRTIAESGSLLFSGLVPSALAIFGPSFGLQRTTDPRYDVPRSVRRLVERGFLRVKKNKGQAVLTLTKKGELFMTRVRRNTLVLRMPKQWDRKWRMVIYDISEDRKRMRGELKDVLRNVGFIPIQKSVWVYPYPCEDLLAMLKADFQVGKEVLYLVVDQLENDAWVRQHYRLPKTVQG